MPPRKTTKSDEPAPASIDEAAAQAAADADALTGDLPSDDEKGKGAKRKPAKRKPGKRRASRKRSLRDPLAELLGFIAVGVSAVNADDGRVILEGAGDLADALDKLARENDSVYRVLDGMLQTSAWGAVAMAAAPIVVGIADNHGLLGGKLASVTPIVTGDAGDKGKATEEAKDDGAPKAEGPGPIGTPPPAGPIPLGPDHPPR